VRPGRLGAAHLLDYNDPSWPAEALAVGRGLGVSAAANTARGGAAGAIRTVRDDGRLATITTDRPNQQRRIAVSSVYVRPDVPCSDTWPSCLHPLQLNLHPPVDPPGEHRQAAHHQARVASRVRHRRQADHRPPQAVEAQPEPHPPPQSRRNLSLIRRHNGLAVTLTVRTTDAAGNKATSRRGGKLRVPSAKRQVGGGSNFKPACSCLGSRAGTGAATASPTLSPALAAVVRRFLAATQPPPRQPD
jgi:hypothetical protein